MLPFRLPTWRLVLALAGALVTVSAAQGHGLPVRKSVSGPEVVEQLVRVSTGGVGSQQDWAIVWAAASPVTLFYDEVLPPELAYVGGSLTCEVLLEGVWQRDCVGTFTAPDTIRTEDTFLDALEQVVISFSTTLASCPVEDAEGFSVSCCQGALTHWPPDPPQVELSDDFPTLATPDATCLTFLPCSSNEAPSLTGSLSSDAFEDCRIQLDWPEAMEPEGEPLAYRIYRGPAPGAVDFSAPYAITTALSFVDTDVEPESEYCYVMRATDQRNDSVDSNETCTTAQDFTPPIQVRPLTLSEAGCSVAVSYTLADACTEILGYDVYRDTISPVVPGVSPLVAQEPFLPWLDTLPDDGTYHYLVVAQTDVGGPIESSEETVVLEGCRVSWGEPLVLTSCAGSDQQLGWDPLPDADDYAVYRGTLASLVAGAYDHEGLSDPAACGLVGTTLTVTAGCDYGSGDFYYLVVVRHGVDEGTYGWSSLGDARPAAAAVCP